MGQVIMIGGRGLAPSRPVEINVLFKSCLIVFISIYLKINKYTYTYIYIHIRKELLKTRDQGRQELPSIFKVLLKTSHLQGPDFWFFMFFPCSPRYQRHLHPKWKPEPRLCPTQTSGIKLHWTGTPAQAKPVPAKLPGLLLQVKHHKMKFCVGREGPLSSGDQVGCYGAPAGKWFRKSYCAFDCTTSIASAPCNSMPIFISTSRHGRISTVITRQLLPVEDAKYQRSKSKKLAHWTTGIKARNMAPIMAPEANDAQTPAAWDFGPFSAILVPNAQPGMLWISVDYTVPCI